MKIKATNPYSEEENPVSWHGWEVGFNSKANTNVSQSEIATYGAAFQKAFYRGQGAQIVKNYEQEPYGSLDHQDAQWAHRMLAGE
jgi:hypothetical protein